MWKRMQKRVCRREYVEGYVEKNAEENTMKWVWKEYADEDVERRRGYKIQH